VAIFRMQCSFAADSALPRDRFVITPHFRDRGGDPLSGDNPQGLADDLCEGLRVWLGTLNNPAREINVRVYNAEHISSPSDPGFPLGEATVNAGVAPGSVVPRELAVCLSFYGDRNVPRRRGRLYIPATFLTTSALSGARPATAVRDAVGALVPVLTGLGGIDVDWGVWSRADRAFHSATNWFVDDEFDVQRRRGLRPTTRTAGTTTEAGIP